MGDPAELGGGTRPNTGSVSDRHERSREAASYVRYLQIGTTSERSERGGQADESQKWDINYIIFSL